MLIVLYREYITCGMSEQGPRLEQTHEVSWGFSPHSRRPL